MVQRLGLRVGLVYGVRVGRLGLRVGLEFRVRVGILFLGNLFLGDHLALDGVGVVILVGVGNSIIWVVKSKIGVGVGISIIWVGGIELLAWRGWILRRVWNVYDLNLLGLGFVFSFIFFGRRTSAD